MLFGAVPFFPPLAPGFDFLEVGLLEPDADKRSWSRCYRTTAAALSLTGQGASC